MKQLPELRVRLDDLAARAHKGARRRNIVYVDHRVQAVCRFGFSGHRY